MLEKCLLCCHSEQKGVKSANSKYEKVCVLEEEAPSFGVLPRYDAPSEKFNHHPSADPVLLPYADPDTTLCKP